VLASFSIAFLDQAAKLNFLLGAEERNFVDFTKVGF